MAMQTHLYIITGHRLYLSLFEKVDGVYFLDLKHKPLVASYLWPAIESYSLTDFGRLSKQFRDTLTGRKLNIATFSS